MHQALQLVVDFTDWEEHIDEPRFPCNCCEEGHYTSEEFEECHMQFMELYYLERCA